METSSRAQSGTAQAHQINGRCSCFYRKDSCPVSHTTGDHRQQPTNTERPCVVSARAHRFQSGVPQSISVLLDQTFDTDMDFLVIRHSHKSSTELFIMPRIYKTEPNRKFVIQVTCTNLPWFLPQGQVAAQAIPLPKAQDSIGLLGKNRGGRQTHQRLQAMEWKSNSNVDGDGGYRCRYYHYLQCGVACAVGPLAGLRTSDQDWGSQLRP